MNIMLYCIVCGYNDEYGLSERLSHHNVMCPACKKTLTTFSEEELSRIPTDFVDNLTEELGDCPRGDKDYELSLH